MLLTHYEQWYWWQKKFCELTKDRYEVCLMAANQVGKCTSVGSIIETEHGPQKIGDIFGKNIKVKTHPNNELRRVLNWIIKRPEECFRITLDDGSWVEVPLGHRILVGYQYLYVSELFQELPASVFCHRLSTSELSRTIRALGVRHWFERLQDCFHRCLVGSRLHGGQFLSDEGSVQVYTPLQGDAQQHSSVSSLWGGMVRKCIGTLSQALRLLSSPGDVCLILAQSFLSSGQACACGDLSLTGNTQNAQQSFSVEHHLQPYSLTNRRLLSKLSSESPSFDVNRIVSVRPVGVKWLYDMEVEERHNYIAGGLVHHNSVVGTDIDAFHLTGDYPEDYPGHKFEFAPFIWCLGYSMEKTRDLLQTKLFGKYDKARGFDGGLVPKDRITGWEGVNVPNAMRTVKVKHKLGGTSVCQFWSYTQGQHAIMGDVVDFVHIDEEPKDQTIRPQVLTRTINGDKGRGGRVIYTFTPENGRTDLVVKFMDEPSKDQAFLKVGWRDAPHITPEKAERLLEQYPEHQRKMRSEGEPMLGHGRIYDIADEFILCDPFQIPDFWDVIVGMDFGYDHPQGFTKLAIDPDNDVVYLTNSWKASKVSANDAWGATKAWSAGCPVAWPADGLMHEKGRDVVKQQKDHYVEAGFNMLFEHASWQDGGNSVENGLYEIMERQRTGRFKVFRGNEQYMEEHRNYHRDEKGKIVKIDDDLVDSARYAYMMRRFSKKNGQVGFNDMEFKMPAPMTTISIC